MNKRNILTFEWRARAEQDTLAKGCWLTGPRCWLCRSCGGKTYDISTQYGV